MSADFFTLTDTEREERGMPKAEAQAIVVSPDSWHDLLDYRDSRAGGRVIAPNYRNAAIYIEHGKRYTGQIRFNEFSRRIMLDENSWSDTDDLAVLEWLQEPHRGIPSITKTAARDAAEFVAHQHAFHPVRDYLNGLAHDGTPRIDSWLIDHAGATDTPYVRAVSGKWLISAVARVMRPGCQVDTALILESPQGTYKSTAIAVLGGPWASTLSNVSLHSKDAIEQLDGKWLVEMSELSGMRRSEVSAVKDFISRKNDYFRVAYGHVTDDHLRQCVFVGTTNDTSYLHDDTGGRRFWPVSVAAFDVDALLAARDQLWAEAAARYRAGETWHLPPELEVVAASEQEDRRVSDPWEDLIGVFLERTVRDAAYKAWPSVSVTEVLGDCLRLPVERFDRSSQMRVVGILTGHGWRLYHPLGEDGKQSKRYRPAETDHTDRPPESEGVGITDSPMASGSESDHTDHTDLINKRLIEVSPTTSIQLSGNDPTVGIRRHVDEKAPPISTPSFSYTDLPAASPPSDADPRIAIRAAFLAARAVKGVV